jgi:hypothetical protein
MTLAIRNARLLGRDRTAIEIAVDGARTRALEPEVSVRVGMGIAAGGSGKPSRAGCNPGCQARVPPS